MAEKRSEKKQNKDSGKALGIGFALWLLAALVLLALFLVNQKRIVANLKSTGFFDKTLGRNPEFVENAEIPSEKPEYKNAVAPIETRQMEIDLNSELFPTLGGHQENSVTVRSGAEIQENSYYGASAGEEGAATRKEASVSVEVRQQTASIKLYFMAINSNGSVSRREVTREMNKSSTPLMDAVNALILGPTSIEESAGCRSLISNGTRLIGASVRNGVATLNFSSEFEFNQYGIEGTRGQLQQLVFTATAFPTVESVQFLVDGERKDYLGSEGVWIGSPLNRNSF